MDKYIDQYYEILNQLSELSGISYEVRAQSDFNNGLKKSKFAYHIKHLYRLTSPLSLERLRSEFGFSAPQSYFYLDSNKELRNFLFRQNLKRMF